MVLAPHMTPLATRSIITPTPPKHVSPIAPPQHIHTLPTTRDRCTPRLHIHTGRVARAGSRAPRASRAQSNFSSATFNVTTYARRTTEDPKDGLQLVLAVKPPTATLPPIEQSVLAKTSIDFCMAVDATVYTDATEITYAMTAPSLIGSDPAFLDSVSAAIASGLDMCIRTKTVNPECAIVTLQPGDDSPIFQTDPPNAFLPSHRDDDPNDSVVGRLYVPLPAVLLRKARLTRVCENEFQSIEKVHPDRSVFGARGFTEYEKSLNAETARNKEPVLISDELHPDATFNPAIIKRYLEEAAPDKAGKRAKVAEANEA